MKTAIRNRRSSRGGAWRPGFDAATARVACALVALAPASLVAQALGAQTTPQRPEAAHVWLDRAGAPLPFQTHREINEYLLNAAVVDRRPIGQGVTGAERLVLERGGVRARAAFRSVDELQRGRFENLPLFVRRVRDAAIFECAAYELSQALGLGRVPPTVWRRIGKTDGSVQIWLEQAMTETMVLERALEAPDVARWNFQKYQMFVFDALIGNLDRNQGNILVDRDWTLWFIDHTRAFAQTRELLRPERIKRCGRNLWLALRNLDEVSLRQRLEPYLTKAELGPLFKRRAKLVAHIEALIAADGEAAVLFPD